MFRRPGQTQKGERFPILGLSVEQAAAVAAAAAGTAAITSSTSSSTRESAGCARGSALFCQQQHQSSHVSSQF